MFNKFYTGDRKLNNFLSFYDHYSNSKSKINNNSLLFLLFIRKNNIDMFNLNSNPFGFDNDNYSYYPLHGFIEYEFQQIEKGIKNSNFDKKIFSNAATNICIAIYLGVNCQSIKEKYNNEELEDIIEKIFLESEHENYFIDDWMLLKKMLNLNLTCKENIPHLSFFRGLILGDRYVSMKMKLKSVIKKTISYPLIKSFKIIKLS